MSHTIDTVEGAIAHSSAYNEIVTVRVDDIRTGFAALIETLGEDCEYDYVDTRDQDGNRLRDVWDASGNGDMDWRVHLVQR